MLISAMVLAQAAPLLFFSQHSIAEPQATAFPWGSSPTSGSIFRAAVAHPSDGRWAESVAIADVNGDGRPDLAVVNYCEGSGTGRCANGANGVVSVLLDNGDGTFQAAVTYGSGGMYGESVAISDVNGDGKPDLLVVNRCASSSNCASPGVHPGSVGVLLGNGDGTFQPAVTYGSGGDAPSSVAVGDVNGDGKPDLLLVNLNNVVGVLLGNGDGTFQPAVTHASGGQNAESVALADVNGDGKPDLLVASRCASRSNCANGVVSVLLGNGNGTFQKAVTYSSGGQSAYSAALGM
jgi:hypothetical protein